MLQTLEPGGVDGSTQAVSGNNGTSEYDFESVLSAMKADQKRKKRLCKVAHVVHASIAIYANPSLAAAYLTDYVKR